MALIAAASAYDCAECGYQTGKWMGFCPQCRERGSLQQTTTSAASADVVSIGEIGTEALDRLPTGVNELDRTLGGGLVPGAALVLGGEPGVGKSPLLLQVAGAIAEGEQHVLLGGGMVHGPLEIGQGPAQEELPLGAGAIEMIEGYEEVSAQEW